MYILIILILLANSRCYRLLEFTLAVRWIQEHCSAPEFTITLLVVWERFVIGHNVIKLWHSIQHNRIIDDFLGWIFGWYTSVEFNRFGSNWLEIDSSCRKSSVQLSVRRSTRSSYVHNKRFSLGKYTWIHYPYLIVLLHCTLHSIRCCVYVLRKKTLRAQIMIAKCFSI